MSDLKTPPVHVDLLEEDKPIAEQRFVCVSFISPENVLARKDLYFFEEFLKDWDFSKTMEKYSQFLNFVSFKYKLKQEDLQKDLEDYVKEERTNLVKTTITDEYKNFLDRNENVLENNFNICNDFQTSTRGIKIRGVFPTQQEAEMRAKMLRDVDPNHDVYVGPVGTWMPWNPDAYKTGRVEYLEKELNELMHEKQNNETRAKQEFEERVKEAKKKAIEENKKNAMETGSKLSQNVDEEGNLYSVNQLGEPSEISAADIRKELFEKDNLADAKGDHGLSDLIAHKKIE